MKTSKINLTGRGKSATICFTYNPANGPLSGDTDVSGDKDLVKRFNRLMALPQPILSLVTASYPVSKTYYQVYAAARGTANELGLTMTVDSPPAYPAALAAPAYTDYPVAYPAAYPAARAANPPKSSASLRYKKTLSGDHREPNGRFVYTKGAAKSPEPPAAHSFMRVLADAIGIASTSGSARRYPTDKLGILAAISAMRSIFVDIVLAQRLSAPARRGRNSISDVRVASFAALVDLYEALRAALPAILLCDVGHDKEHVRSAGEHLLLALSYLVQQGRSGVTALPENTILSPEILRKVAQEIALAARAARDTDATDAIERLIDLYE
jgi:hypothetical protein